MISLHAQLLNRSSNLCPQDAEASGLTLSISAEFLAHLLASAYTCLGKHLQYVMLLFSCQVTDCEIHRENDDSPKTQFRYIFITKTFTAKSKTSRLYHFLLHTSKKKKTFKTHSIHPHLQSL